METVYDKEISPMIEVEQKVESPDFKLCLDIGHAHCYSPRSLSDAKFNPVTTVTASAAARQTAAVI